MVLAAVVFAFGLLSRRLEGTILTAPIVFVVAGMVLGPAGFGLVEFGLDDHTVLLVGAVALAIVLFTDAARINLSALRQNEGLPLRLLGIGMPLTIAIGTAAAALLLTNLSIGEAAIVGTVRAPTDAALGQAVVSNPRVPVRVRQALNVEAGLNDGLSVPFLALLHGITAAPLSAVYARCVRGMVAGAPEKQGTVDRKSTRLNSSHANISYAVFCLKKKKKQTLNPLLSKQKKKKKTKTK